MSTEDEEITIWYQLLRIFSTFSTKWKGENRIKNTNGPTHPKKQMKLKGFSSQVTFPLLQVPCEKETKNHNVFHGNAYSVHPSPWQQVKWGGLRQPGYLVTFPAAIGQMGQLLAKWDGVAWSLMPSLSRYHLPFLPTTLRTTLCSTVSKTKLSH